MIVPPCTGKLDLFFGPELDGRKEPNRAQREADAKHICSGCPIRIMCLENALVLREHLGVWGGLSEAERKLFARFLRKRGHGEVPEGRALQRELTAFLRWQKALSESE